jgi:hypothetical protein
VVYSEKKNDIRSLFLVNHSVHVMDICSVNHPLECLLNTAFRSLEFFPRSGEREQCSYLVSSAVRNLSESSGTWRPPVEHAILRTELFMLACELYMELCFSRTPEYSYWACGSIVGWCRGFDSRWGHCIFQLIWSFEPWRWLNLEQKGVPEIFMELKVGGYIFFWQKLVNTKKGLGNAHPALCSTFL